MKVPTILVPIAHGSESLETVCVVNVLRRAELEVTVASIESELTVTGTRGIRLTADRRFLDTGGQRFDMIVLPGGEKGSEALGRHAPLIERLQQQDDDRRWFAAICAAPALALAPHHLLDGRQATCHPAFRGRLPKFVDEPVVRDGHVVTSQGAGTALAFALKLAELLAGIEKSRAVAAQMVA
ncbi:MAG: DJ-1/PfpI family protein [Nevskia sp.]|nr:DJ-1/PfpI family protein [Nevskia sp.]